MGGGISVQSIKKTCLLAFVLSLLAVKLSAEQHSPPIRRVTGKKWLDMDYGPFLSATIAAEPEGNIAYKGIAVPLDPQSPDSRGEAILFDTDLLRYASAWVGEFVALRGIVYDGLHGPFPEIAGEQLWATPRAPGWSQDGVFKDPREFPYGPLPSEWAHWRGLYLHDDRVIFSYTVGAVPVLEMPSIERNDEARAFCRNIQLGERRKPLITEVAYVDGAEARVRPLAGGDNAGAGSTADSLAVLLLDDDEFIAAAVIGGTGGERWIAVDGHVRLEIPAGKPTTMKLLIWRGPRQELPHFVRMVGRLGPPPDIVAFTRGGPPR